MEEDPTQDNTNKVIKHRGTQSTPGVDRMHPPPPLEKLTLILSQTFKENVLSLYG